MKKIWNINCACHTQIKIISKKNVISLPKLDTNPQSQKNVRLQKDISEHKEVFSVPSRDCRNANVCLSVCHKRFLV